jgi:translation initiation factor RLI1
LDKRIDSVDKEEVNIDGNRGLQGVCASNNAINLRLKKGDPNSLYIVAITVEKDNNDARPSIVARESTRDTENKVDF